MTTTVRSSAARVLLVVALLLCIAAAHVSGEGASKPQKPSTRYISYAAKPNDDCIKMVPAPAYCCGKSAMFGRCPIGWRPAPPRVGTRTAAAAAGHAP